MKFSEIKGHLGLFRAGIAGAGGLGSNCAAALARSGIGSIVLCDHDRVEVSNLNRQYYFLSQAGMLKCEALRDNIALINNNTEVIVHNVVLTPENIPEIFRSCHVIVEALDSKEMKEMLIETVQKKMPGIPLVAGSGIAGFGNANNLKCRKIDDTLYVCGDEMTEASEEMPPLAPGVSIVANMQADTVISILLKNNT